MMILTGAGQIGLAIARRIGYGMKIIVGDRSLKNATATADVLNMAGFDATPLAIDEFNGPRGDFYKNMFASCPAGRPGTADEVANVAELLMGDRGAFITGSDFLADGGATAAYFYSESFKD